MGPKMVVVQGEQPLSVKLPRDLKKRVRRAAALSEQSMSAFVRAVIEQAVARAERTAA
jgi:uncharacterized protein (DUF1778 family)